MQTVRVGDRQWEQLGLGTWQLAGQPCREAVEHALALGYRHIDTAVVYENEAEVGRGLARSAVPRDKVWLTTKIPAGSERAAAAEEACEGSLRRLGTDYIDLLLVHWPSSQVPMEETLAALERLEAAGKTRFIGVSNFTRGQMKRAKALAPSIVNNQVELHPFLGRARLRRDARSLGLVVTAYCPLARGQVNDDRTLQEIGEHYAKGPAQVALRWLVQRGIVAVPKAASAEHRESNFDIFDFELSAEMMARIDGLDARRRLIDPPWSPEWDDDDDDVAVDAP